MTHTEQKLADLDKKQTAEKASLKYRRYCYAFLQGNLKEAIEYLEAAILLAPDNEDYKRQVPFILEYVANLPTKVKEGDILTIYGMGNHDGNYAVIRTNGDNITGLTFYDEIDEYPTFLPDHLG